MKSDSSELRETKPESRQRDSRNSFREQTMMPESCDRSFKRETKQSCSSGEIGRTPVRTWPRISRPSKGR